MSFDPWKIIDRYFKRDPYYLTVHHLDSYNQFIDGNIEDEIGIEYILKRENPLYIPKDKDGDTYNHEIYIWFAEEVDSDGNIISSTDSHIQFAKPILYKDNEEGDAQKSKYMYPQLARNYNATYASNVFINMTILIKEKGEVVHHKFHNKINIGKIPIMLHSKICLLNGLSNKQLRNLGECKYDKGGYFIINGKEKVIISQEKKADNMIYINKSFDDKFTYEATLKSVSKEGFQSSRTNSVGIEKSGRITIRILGVADRIPIFILFRALGIQSDYEICKLILGEDPKTCSEEGSILLQALLPSIKDSNEIYNTETALKFIALKSTISIIRKFNIDAISIINNNFLPNYNNQNTYKSYYLGLMIQKLLKTSLGIISETDRDHYKNKRVDLSGFLINELYRELFEKFKKNVKLKIDNRYERDYKKGKFTDMNFFIQDGNIRTIFDYTIIENDLDKSYRTKWGTGISARDGVVQDINRNTLLGTTAVLRRVTFPLPSGSKAIGPRKLHGSQWGYICPSESPDGGNVGIVNHLAISSGVSFWINPSGIINCLNDLKLIPLDHIVPDDTYFLTKVFINNMWIGIHQDPVLLYKKLTLYKRNAIINVLTSIYWDMKNNEIYINTDQGRLVKPLIKLTDNTSKLFSDDFDIDSKKWVDFIYGIRTGKNCSLYDSNYYKQDIGSDEELEENACIIEYLDSSEMENVMIATNYKSINTDIKYTHCEIHCALILSATVNTIPFPQHAQAPRNVYSAHQMKQTMGVYNTNFGSRFETFSHILHYPQRPLVDTKFSKYVFSRNLPSGINAIVAIGCYSGYNQEDSIILNKSSMERGMFQSLYHRTYQDKEEDQSKTGGFGSKITKFCNPAMVSKNYPIKDMNSEKNFDLLNEHGFINVDQYVTENDVIIGKFTVTDEENENGNTLLQITGETVKTGTSGTIDKVLVVERDHSLRLAKVRVRKIKIPEIGDKFSARSGQKGTIGMVMEAADMPHTADGIVPDIIMNPHAIPSRMTINHLLECILGKSACHYGNIGNCTAFEESNTEQISESLKKTGYEKYGNEILYNGLTGEQMNTHIFIGPTYFQRLKLLVSDKIQSRATGPKEYLTKQAAAGRANKGGLRIGEMERDAILAHGAAAFMQESTMKRSDDYKTFFNNRNGMILNENIYDTDDNINIVQMPYSMKLFIQELQCMSITPKCILENHEDDTNLLNEIIPIITNNIGMDNIEDEEQVEIDIDGNVIPIDYDDDDE